MHNALHRLLAFARSPGVLLGLTLASWITIGLVLVFNAGVALECLSSHLSCLDVPSSVLAMLLAVACALLWGGRLAEDGFSPVQRPPRAGRWELVAVAGMLLLAGFARLWRLGDLPQVLDYDTAQNGWIALTLWERLPDEGIRWVLTDWATGNESLYFYLVGLSLKLFGVSPEALRLPSALVGIATVLAIYLLGRQLFSTAVGLWAGTLAALMPGHIMHSRMATRPVLTGLFVALGLLFLARALAADDGRRRRWTNLVLCGVMLGLGLNGYEAFRLFPLAVATALLWHRIFQRRLLQGLGELAVVAGVAVVLTLPIFIFAIRQPELYFEHVSTNSIWHQIQQQGSLLPLLSHARDTLVFFAFGLPLFPNQDFGPVAPLVLVPLMFLCGLVGLLRGFWRRRATATPGARTLVLATLVWMAAPFLLSRFAAFAARRYFGEMVPFYLLAGGATAALARTFRGVVDSWRPRPWTGRLLTAAAGALALAVPLLALPSLMQVSHEPSPEGRERARDETILRWCLGQTERADVYLEPGLVGDNYLARFYLKSQQLDTLPTAWPLPPGPLTREVLLVSAGVPWWDSLEPLVGAHRGTVTLPRPNGEAPLRLRTFRVTRDALAGARMAPQASPTLRRATLLVPTPGRYRLRVGRHNRGQLTVDGLRPEPAEDRPHVALALAAGPHRLAFLAHGGRAPLQWRPPGSRAWQTVPAGLLWLPLEDAFPWPPASVDSPLRVVEVQDFHLSVDPAYQHTRSLQDIAAGPDGVLIADLDRLVARRWPAVREGEPRPVLLDRAGRPLENPETYAISRHKQLSLDSSVRGSWLLRRDPPTVLGFDRQGRQRGRLTRGLLAPLDLAEDQGRLYIADPQRGALLVTDAGRLDPPGVAVGGVSPVAVDASAGRLAFLDQRRHQLVVRATTGTGEAQRVALGSVNRQMRLQLLDDGQLLVVDPLAGTVLLMDRQGRLLAPGGDPLALTTEVARLIPGQPLAAHWDRRAGVLLVLIRPDVVVRVELVSR
jgi:uncharacterized membrane protein